MFTLFQRLHTNDKYKGTGLGLAICRRIVEYHGGAITGTSRESEGATFKITLPVNQTRS
jgi:signal transduction histidine kinase